jgi:subtilisin family serine protease
VQAARAAGVSIIVAAGNDNQDAAGFVPASFPEVVTVSACDLRREKAGYSNFGTVVDVAAPGGDTSVDRNGDGFADGVLSTAGDDCLGPDAVRCSSSSRAPRWRRRTWPASSRSCRRRSRRRTAARTSARPARRVPGLRLDHGPAPAGGRVLVRAGPHQRAQGRGDRRRRAVAGAPVAGPAAGERGLRDRPERGQRAPQQRGQRHGLDHGVTKSVGADFLSVTPSAALPAAAPVTLALAIDRAGFAPGTQLAAAIYRDERRAATRRSR